MTQRILLNDGTVYEDASCSENRYEMWIFVKGELKKVFDDFIDPMKTMVIRLEVCNVSNEKIEEKSYAGYTVFSGMLVDNPATGIYNIRLKKQI